jgi:AcrR family transcriptional regulator
MNWRSVFGGGPGEPMRRRVARRSGAVVIMTGKTVRAEQVSATRELILTAAERLFAEHGVFAVSNRQVSEAAGQGNNTAVGYHFGTKTDLVRAIVAKHSGAVERLREDLLHRYAGSDDLRDWVICLVHPFTDHLAELDGPTWYARFSAQVMTDPVLRQIIIDNALATPSIQTAVEGIRRRMGPFPAPIYTERLTMARALIMHTCAERERALADGDPVARPTWQSTGDGLTDAIGGLLQAPVTSEH